MRMNNSEEFERKEKQPILEFYHYTHLVELRENHSMDRRSPVEIRYKEFPNTKSEH
jgi:hypothetical protein